MPLEKILRNCVAIVQARMTSTRLPGKSLLPFGDTTILGCTLARLRNARRLDAICVATSDEVADDAIAAAACALGVGLYRGSRDDVLARFAGAAREMGAQTVVRITADCPLIDPAIVDAVLLAHTADGADYTSNVRERTFPRGLDVEVVTIEALERACREALRRYEREHVTPYIYEHPEYFRVASVTDPSGLRRGDWRWTIDTPQDYLFLQELAAALLPRHIVDAGTNEIIEVLARHPEITALNSSVVQKHVSE